MSRSTSPPRVRCHLLLCASPTVPRCAEPGIGAASWERLKQLIRDLKLEDPLLEPGVVMRSKVDCLRVCRDGPVMLIWPDGITYGGITPDRIERIVRQHVIGGVPVEDWIVGRCSFSGN